MSFFKFNPFSKKTKGSNDEPKEQTLERRKEIVDAYGSLIKNEYPDMLENAILFMAAGIFL